MRLIFIEDTPLGLILSLSKDENDERSSSPQALAVSAVAAINISLFTVRIFIARVLRT